MQTVPLRSKAYSRPIGQRQSEVYEHARNRALIRCLKIVADLRKGTIVFTSDELVPKMLAVGETRGTSDFEGAVIDLLLTLAKKIPSGEYRRDFEHHI
jgi:hypothetical protein